MSESEIIHIDGGTAVGKDTVARLVKPKIEEATGINWKIRTGSLSEHNPYTDLARNLNKKGISHKTIFTTLAALSLAYDIHHSDVDSPTIMAGFNALRSAAYHTADNTKLQHLFVDMLKHAAPMIGPSFILEASLEERLRRLQNRPEQQTKNDKLLITHPENVLKLDETLLRLGVLYLGSEKVDTTPLSPEQVAKEITDRYLGIISKDI